MEPVNVTLEFTPNPNTLKFVVNRTLMPQGAANFTHADHAKLSPLASRLFAVNGVQAVLIGGDFVTVTKAVDGEWDALAEEVPNVLRAHFESGEPTLGPGWSAFQATAQANSSSEIERKIREILDIEIRPAVAMDGGDITFGRYENGVVYLHLQGSCSSCPSSVATLKMGVETRLREAVPEVQEVVQIPEVG